MAPAASTRTPRKRTITPAIAVVVVWLVVGAVLMVLTTWCGLIYETKAGLNGQPLPETELTSERYAWPFRRQNDWVTTPRVVSVSQSLWMDELFYIVRSNAGMGFVEHIKGGRPARCLGMGFTREFEQGAWPVSKRISAVGYLPLHPVWPGFALNTLFYAAIAWGLWRIPVLIRRQRRRGRGLCLRCAYDRAGLAPGAACPECGHVPRPDASVSSA